MITRNRILAISIFLAVLICSSCAAPTQSSGSITAIPTNGSTSSAAGTSLPQENDKPPVNQDSSSSGGLSLADHAAVPHEPAPPLYAFDLEHSQLLIFTAEAKDPVAFTMPMPFQFTFHPSPDHERVAYLGGDLTLDPGLELHVFQTSDGQQETRLAILAPGWQRSNEAGELPEEDPVPAISEFEAMAWSPDGRQLAFAGAIERFAAELYLLNTSTQAVVRAANLSYAPALPAWSPDGRKVAFILVSSFGTGAGWNTAGIGIVQVETGELQIVTSDEQLRVRHWLSEDTLLLSRWNLTWGMHDLGVMDTNTGVIDWFFEGPLFTEVDIPDGGRIALLTSPQGTSTANASGIYVVSPSQPAAICLPLGEESLYTLEWSPALNLLYASFEAETVFLTADCAERVSISLGGWTQVSPDGEWVVARPPEGNEIVLYSTRDGEVQRWDELSVSDIHWLPDSSGLLVLTPERELYTIRFDPDGESLFLPPELISSNAILNLRP